VFWKDGFAGTNQLFGSAPNYKRKVIRRNREWGGWPEHCEVTPLNCTAGREVCGGTDASSLHYHRVFFILFHLFVSIGKCCLKFATSIHHFPP
jgi:hypothetical protein